MKKTLIIISTILLIASAIIIKIINSPEYKLKKKGYSKSDITYILSKEEANNILNIEYNPYLVDIMKHKYYIKENLSDYLKYTNENKNIDEVISIINVGANKKWYSNIKKTDINYGIKMLVNKFNYLDETYIPNDIVDISNWYSYEGHKIKQEVYDKYKEMWYAAKENNLILLVNSSYRTQEEQQKEYNNSNDEYAARPGHSEHQTGLALDIITFGIVNGMDFENTPEFKWLQDNSYKYGFILRYPKDKEYLTGYNYEPWHYRYIGIETAKIIYENNLTYDEYYSYYCEYKSKC